MYRILREISIYSHKTSMNLYILVHTSSTDVLWMILLESYTPGQGGSRRYLPGCTIACFPSSVHHGIYSLVSHATRRYTQVYAWMYYSMFACYSTSWHILPVAWHGAIPVCTSMYLYVQDMNGMYWYVLVCTCSYWNKHVCT